MTPSDLARAIAETGHERYRWLTSEANPDAWSRENYRAEVERRASGATDYQPASIPVAPIVRGCCGGGIDLEAPPGSEKVTLR